MTKLEHRRRTGPPAILAGPCEPDCPACAQERRDAGKLRDDVGEILDIWLDAVRNGERTVETALHEVRDSLSLLRDADRTLALARFTAQARDAKPPKVKSRGPGMPTAWDKTNFDLVELMQKHEGLPKNNVANAYAMGLQTVFPHVAKFWGQRGILVGAADVQRRYYIHKKKVYKPFPEYNSH